MAASQAVDPGSTPGYRTVLFCHLHLFFPAVTCLFLLSDFNDTSLDNVTAVFAKDAKKMRLGAVSPKPVTDKFSLRFEGDWGYTQMASAFDIEDFAIKTVPPKAYYIPNFITAEDEKELLDQIYGAPKPKWTKLSGRQLQNWGGLPHPKGMVVEKLPQWLQKYVTKVGMLPVFNGVMPNHVLVNEYQPGQGIMPHEDGPLFYPVVSTINLGSHTFLDFYHPIKNEVHTGQEHSDQLSAGVCLEDRYFMSLLLEPRSLFLLTEQLYHNFLHGIEKRTCDVVSDTVRNRDMCNVTPGETLGRSTRISLTIRNVPKTLKFKLKLGK